MKKILLVLFILLFSNFSYSQKFSLKDKSPIIVDTIFLQETPFVIYTLHAIDTTITDFNTRIDTINPFIFITNTTTFNITDSINTIMKIVETITTITYTTLNITTIIDIETNGIITIDSILK
jgi:hypothetical protein